MMTISNALAWAANAISTKSTSPQLDAEVLLAHVLKVPRSYFYAWPARALNSEEEQCYAALVKRKLHGEPVAYITGTREFWSLDFTVTPDTLIPRPETELLVEIVLDKLKTRADNVTIADLGTGCGAIALSIAVEKPQWQVHATDRVDAALSVARHNAERFGIKNIFFELGNWCHALPSVQFDAIMSNPPYIAKGDLELNQDVIESEPHFALFAGEDGLEDSRQIIFGARNYLKSGGYLIIEHGHQQADRIALLFEEAGYTEIKLYKDMANLDRATAGCFFTSIAS